MSPEVVKSIMFALIPLTISFFGLPFLIRWAQRKGWTSVQDFRRKESESIPLMGGTIIWPVVLGLSLVPAYYTGENIWVIAALPMLVTSLIDDIYQLSAKPKLLAQFVSICLWAALINPEQTLLLESLGLPYIFALPLTLFWVLGMINAVNMIDGIDGLASMFAMIGGAFLLFLLPQFSASFYVTLSFIFGYLGFLLHNKPPAKVYLGDSGSTFIGFFLSTQLAVFQPASHMPFAWVIPLLVMSYPGCDALLAMYRRKVAGQPMFSGDHDHIHHKLGKLGLSVPQSLAVIAILNFYCGFTAIGLKTASNWAGFGVIITLSLITLFSFLLGLFFLERKLAFQLTRLCHEKLKTLIPPNDAITDMDNFTQVFQYDLAHYFKDLQARGFEETLSFLHGVDRYLKYNHSESEIYLVHNTTIVTVDLNHESNTFANNQRATAFRNFLSDYQLLKNDKGIPRGMSIYSEPTSCAKVLGRYGLFMPFHSAVKFSRSA